jgi:hypothetical protein
MRRLWSSNYRLTTLDPVDKPSELGFFDFALPEDFDTPSGVLKVLLSPRVPCLGAFELLTPKRLIGLRKTRPAATWMLVPEATVDEHNYPVFR